MKKILCSIGLGPHQQLLALAEPSFRRYADRHGYDTMLVNGPLVEPRADRWLKSRPIASLVQTYEAVTRFLLRPKGSQSGSFRVRLADGRRIAETTLRRSDARLQAFVSGPRPPAWEKIALISRLLADYDAVFWVDSDAIILDDSRDIIGEILPRKWLYLIKEKSATMGDHVNTGVLLILRNETSHRFLREVWRQRDLIYHMWWEQAATLRLLGYDLDPVRKVRPSPFDEGVHIIDTVWNSMPFDPVEQPRIRHYAGIPLEDRVRLMTEDNLRLGLQSTTSRNE